MMSESIKKAIVEQRSGLHRRQYAEPHVWARIYDGVTTPIAHHVEDNMWSQLLDAIDAKMGNTVDV